MNLVANPRIRSSDIKETFALNGNWGRPEFKFCDKFDKIRYVQHHFGEVLWDQPHAEPEGTGSKSLVMGDFSTSNFHCGCCMETLMHNFPRLKVVVLLRDPIRRAISRYEEQKIFKSWYYEEIKKKSKSVGDYLTKESQAIHSCAQERLSSNDTWTQIREKCVEPSNIVGWSLYDWFVPIVLDVVPPEQLFWVYTEDMANNMRPIVHKIEEFLNVEHYFPEEDFPSFFNVRGHFGWKVAKDPDDNGKEESASADPLQKNKGLLNKLCTIFR